MNAMTATRPMRASKSNRALRRDFIVSDMSNSEMLWPLKNDLIPFMMNFLRSGVMDCFNLTNSIFFGTSSLNLVDRNRSLNRSL